ncbi:MAG TPA: S9 family peptidase, partial [Vicinamibacteria bacterium]
MKTALAVPGLALIAAMAVAQSPPTMAPNENLVVEGVPPIPAALADTVARYTESRSATFQGWHPTRREMLITTRFADTAQVHRVSMPGGARTQLTFFPDRVQDATFPPVGGEFFLFRSDTGGNEFSQIYRYDLSGGAVTLLTDGKSQNGGIRWSHRGDRFAYGSTRRNGRDRDLYVMDPRDPKSDRKLLEVEGGGWGVLAWSPDDEQLLVSESISANESYLWLVGVRTGERKLLTPKGGAEKVDYNGGQFARDGKAIYVTTDRESEFHRLALVDLATGRHTYFTTHIPWDVSGFVLSRDGGTLAFVTNEDGADTLHLMDTTTGKERPAARFGLGEITDLEWRPQQPELALSFASAQSPKDVYTVEAATGRVERWTESETGGLEAASLAKPELVR